MPRNAITTAGVAATLLTGTPPAAAATVATFEGSAAIGCFGCGTYGPAGNSASLRITGIYDNQTMVNAAGTASFVVTSGTTTCFLTGTANGQVAIGGDVRSFLVSWLGSYGSIVIAKSGRPTIEGSVTWVARQASPPTCGSRVEVDFAGELHGA